MSFGIVYAAILYVAGFVASLAYNLHRYLLGETQEKRMRGARGVVLTPIIPLVLAVRGVVSILRGIPTLLRVAFPPESVPEEKPEGDPPYR